VSSNSVEIIGIIGVLDNPAALKRSLKAKEPLSVVRGLILGRGLRVQAPYPAGVEHKGGHGVVAIEIVHSQDHDVVVARLALLLHAALQPGAGAVEENGSALSGMPVEAGETVAAAAAQLPASSLLARSQDTDAEPRGQRESGPGGGAVGHADQHHCRLEGNGCEGADSDAHRAAADGGGQGRHPGWEGPEDTPQQKGLEGLCQGHFRILPVLLPIVRRAPRTAPTPETRPSSSSKSIHTMDSLYRISSNSGGAMNSVIVGPVRAVRADRHRPLRIRTPLREGSHVQAARDPHAEEHGELVGGGHTAPAVQPDRPRPVNT
jgi:hypothetical protein